MENMPIMKMPQKTAKSTGTPFQSKVSILFLVALMLFGLSACSYQGDPAKIIVEYTVPFAETGSRWDEILLLEEDDFGRRLYSSRSSDQHVNVFSDFVQTDTRNKPVLVYILVQSYDAEYAYCYDDVCYMYTASFEPTDTAVLETFKQQNDWNRPLDKDKLTAYSRDMELIIDLPALREDEKAAALGKALGRTIDKYYVSAVYTPQVEPIYVLREVKEWITTETDIVFGKSYVFILDDNQTVTQYEVLNGSVDQWRDQINAFKASCYNTKDVASK